MRSTAAGIEPYEEHRALAGTRAVDRSRNGCIMAAFVPLDSRAYRFDIVLRGRDSTPFEGRT